MRHGEPAPSAPPPCGTTLVQQQPQQQQQDDWFCASCTETSFDGILECAHRACFHCHRVWINECDKVGRAPTCLTCDLHGLHDGKAFILPFDPKVDDWKWNCLDNAACKGTVCGSKSMAKITSLKRGGCRNQRVESSLSSKSKKSKKESSGDKKSADKDGKDKFAGDGKKFGSITGIKLDLGTGSAGSRGGGVAMKGGGKGRDKPMGSPNLSPDLTETDFE